MSSESRANKINTPAIISRRKRSNSYEYTGKNIKAIRQSHGWTQEQLAEKCNLLDWDLSRSTLAKIESNVRRVTDIEIILLATALNVNVDELF